MKFESIVDALNKLGMAKVLTPDPDLEVWIRGEMGAPAVDRATIVKLREAAVTSGNPNANAQDPDGQGTNGQEGAVTPPAPAPRPTRRRRTPRARAGRITPRWG